MVDVFDLCHTSDRLDLEVAITESLGLGLDIYGVLSRCLIICSRYYPWQNYAISWSLFVHDAATVRSGYAFVTDDNCPRVVTRAQWGARPPRSVVDLKLPVPKIFIHHTATAPCSTQETCSKAVRGIQNFHMDTRG